MTAGATDTLTVEILRGRIQSMVDEAGAALVRTAFSSIVREAKDFACAVMTTEGHTIAQSSQSIPVFLGTMTHTVQVLLRELPPSEWGPEDVLVTNDPWIGTGHLFDFNILAPIFERDELVGFAAIVAHVPDVGGTPFAAQARDVFEEGLRILPEKLVSSAGRNETLIRIIRANVRVPDEVVGDIEAMLNAAAVLARRTAELCRELTSARFNAACRDLEVRSETFMRGAIGALPDGVSEGTIGGESVDGSPYTIRARLTVDGETLEIDFAGSSPQVAAAVNSCFAYSQAYALFAIKCVLGPDVPFNEGLRAPIRVVAPEGTVVNSRFPAPGALRNLVGHFIPTLIFELLARLLPQPPLAECGAPRPIINFSGTDGDGRAFVAPLLIMGGFGARPDADGPSCLAFPTNTQVVPVEITESIAPMRIEEKELVTDSAGPGEFRGGLGQRVTVRCLAGTMNARIAAQRLNQPPDGVSGGGAAQPTQIWINGERWLTMPERVVMAPGDTLTVVSPGGGGYGPASARERELVERDVAGGYVSPQAAEAHYGSAVEHEGDAA